MRLLRLLDWNGGVLVSSFRVKFMPGVLAVIKELQIEIEFDSETFAYFLPKHKAREFVIDMPNGYTLKRMSTLDHARTANDLWPYKHDGSLYYLKRLIDLNPSVGVFDTVTDELIAWCFRFQSGFLGALQVKEAYFRQGFGTLATKAFCKVLGEMEMDVLVLIADKNIASKRTFKALGFEKFDCCHWIKTIPKQQFEWSD